MDSPRKLAVIGDPISHSLSPVLHNAMAEKLGLPYQYDAVQVPVGALDQWLVRVKEESFAGFNATMPHKLHLLPYMDELTAQAQFFGAVNTVKCEHGRLLGHNTDADGFACMLAEHNLGFCGANVTILGAGGSAGAIAKKAVQDGAKGVFVMNRTMEKARELCQMDGCMQAMELSEPIPSHTDLLINTIPAGNNLPTAFVQELSNSCAVFDILYAPPKTPLLLAAEERGLLAVNGLGMLVHQAILAFEFFTGVKPDQNAMAKHLYSVLHTS